MGVQAEEQFRVWVTMDQVHHSWNSVMCLSVLYLATVPRVFSPMERSFSWSTGFFSSPVGFFPLGSSPKIN